MMTETTIQTTGHISSDPAICGGKPCIAGTRINIQDIYIWHELDGLSVDEIVADFPHLSHAAVYSALSYAWDHRSELLRQLQEDQEWVESFKATHGSGPITHV